MTPLLTSLSGATQRPHLHRQIAADRPHNTTQHTRPAEEPFWFDQVSHAAHDGKGNDASTVQLVHVCHVLEYAQLVRHAQLGLRSCAPTHFIMNPKGFGHRLIEYVRRAFPQHDGPGEGAPLRHVFMYRHCAKGDTCSR